MLEIFQVQALYDFEAQPDTGEMSISSGDILTVTRTDVGEGWWEGTNQRGESGLFPEAYVEVRYFEFFTFSLLFTYFMQYVKFSTF